MSRNRRRWGERIGGVCVAVVSVGLGLCGGLGCGDDADSVTLIFRVADSRCRVNAHVGAHEAYGGTPVPGLPIGYGDPEVTFVYRGDCPSERIYITSEEIGDSIFTTDYRFDCRDEPFVVEVYYTSTYCDERIIE